MTDDIGDAQLRRHLTAVHLVVLDIVHTSGPVDPPEVARIWGERRSDIGPRHRAALPRMSGQILWRLDNLGVVERGAEGYRMTPLGEHARKVVRFDR